MAAEAAPPAARRGPGQRTLLALIRLYQLAFAPMYAGSCRFVPSCSAYAAEAIERHGAARGGLLALRRLLRCHPFGRHGLDPVPPSPSRSL
jgi:putative membrane protein insertion efficiency factor